LLLKVYNNDAAAGESSQKELKQDMVHDDDMLSKQSVPYRASFAGYAENDETFDCVSVHMKLRSGIMALHRAGSTSMRHLLKTSFIGWY
jgi:hypothetical protein